MEEAASANEGAALPGGANGNKDAAEAAANQQRDDGSAVANGDAPLHKLANERKRSCGSANQDTETREVTNDSKEPQAANEATGCKPATNEITARNAPANEDSRHKASTNQDSGRKPPANRDAAPLSTNQNAAPRPNEIQTPPLQDPTHDLTPLAAAANQAQDPWDWSLEEAWLRAPEEEGLEAWGAELEGWEEEPDDEEEELEDWEVELEHCGVELMGEGAELKSQREEVKGQGVELESSKGQGVGPKGQGAELAFCAVDPIGQGVELESSKGQGVGFKGQGVELEVSKGQGVGFKGQGVELEGSKGQGVGFKGQGVELVGSKGQGVGFKGQGVELEGSKGQGVGFKGQGVELEGSKGQGVGFKGQGVELVGSKGQGVGFKDQGVELEGSKGQGVEFKDQREELERCEEDPNDHRAELQDSRDHGVGFNPQGEEPKGQGAELDRCGVAPNSQEAELRAKWADPPTPEPSHWLSSPDGAWSKLTIRAGRGLARPGPGSLCRVRLSVPDRGRSSWPAPAALSGCGGWRSVRLGSAEGRWSALLDAGLETMTRGELAWLRPGGADRALGVRLGRFTPAPSFWAVPPSVRWPSVASGHARAAHLLRRGQVGAAARVFRRALRAAAAAAGPPPVPPAVGELKAELHAGLAAAQIRLGLPAAAAANAGKALALRPAHLGARYARGVACAAMMDLEAAREDLLAVLRARPGHAGATRELGRVRDKARQRDTQLATRLGKMFA